MLVLSRKTKTEEHIVIDLRQVDLSQIPQDQRLIRIWAVETRGDKVRLGIEAPRDVPVHRNEIYEAMQQQTALSSVVK
jgi:carbon storage regulator CsrA